MLALQKLQTLFTVLSHQDEARPESAAILKMLLTSNVRVVRHASRAAAFDPATKTIIVDESIVSLEAILKSRNDQKNAMRRALEVYAASEFFHESLEASIHQHQGMLASLGWTEAHLDHVKETSIVTRQLRFLLDRLSAEERHALVDYFKDSKHTRFDVSKMQLLIEMLSSDSPVSVASVSQHISALAGIQEASFESTITQDLQAFEDRLTLKLVVDLETLLSGVNSFNIGFGSMGLAQLRQIAAFHGLNLKLIVASDRYTQTSQVQSLLRENRYLDLDEATIQTLQIILPNQVANEAQARMEVAQALKSAVTREKESNVVVTQRMAGEVKVISSGSQVSGQTKLSPLAEYLVKTFGVPAVGVDLKEASVADVVADMKRKLTEQVGHGYAAEVSVERPVSLALAFHRLLEAEENGEVLPIYLNQGSMIELPRQLASQLMGQLEEYQRSGRAVAASA
jgi:hypothetical protein